VRKFRWDAEQSVLWAGERSYPAHFHRSSATEHIPPDYVHPVARMEMRQALVWFENQWQLSTIWGDATYSSNRMAFLDEQPPFIEEPTTVEVGVLVPTPITIPAAEFDLPSGMVRMPERETHLWGEPLGHVTVEEYHRLTDLVMMLPTDIDLPQGEWEDVTGFCDLLITAGLDRTL
jgi:hypothetical protein